MARTTGSSRVGLVVHCRLGAACRPPLASPSFPPAPATVIGQRVVALLAVSAAVSAALRGDHTPETLVTLGGAVVTAVTLMAGRYLQSYALLRGAGAGAQAPGSAPSVTPAGVIVVRCCQAEGTCALQEPVTARHDASA